MPALPALEGLELVQSARNPSEWPSGANAQYLAEQLVVHFALTDRG